MDLRHDPYTPNAGASPPVLAGRDAEAAAFEVLLDRLDAGRTGQSLVLTGWRGMGKTVLLERLGEQATRRGWATVSAEVRAGDPLAPKVGRLATRALLSIAPAPRWADRGRRAAAVIKSFQLRVEPDGAITAGLDVDAAAGAGDSGVLADDLSDVLVGLGEAAAEHGTGVVLLLDEMHELAPDDLEALLSALQRTVQKALPVTLVGAGLPRLRGAVADAQSYAERMFVFPDLDVLAPDDAAAALTVPADGVCDGWDDDAVAVVVHWTGGYPYFLQEFGSAAWAAAAGPRITVADVYAALPLLEARLDSGFFRTRLERASEHEAAFMRAMAATGDGPWPAQDVAGRLHGRSAKQIAAVRTSLLDKGLVHVPAPGTVAFTVPQFASFLRRAGGA